MDNGVVFAAPGEGEVAEAMVPAGSIEVEDAGELPVLEAEVPGGEVAVDVDAWAVLGTQVGDAGAGAFEVPVQHADLLGAFALVLGQDAVERGIAEGCLAASPAVALAEVCNLRQVGVALCQESPARSLLDQW